MLSEVPEFQLLWERMVISGPSMGAGHVSVVGAFLFGRVNLGLVTGRSDTLPTTLFSECYILRRRSMDMTVAEDV